MIRSGREANSHMNGIKEGGENFYSLLSSISFGMKLEKYRSRSVQLITCISEISGNIIRPSFYFIFRRIEAVLFNTPFLLSDSCWQYKYEVNLLFRINRIQFLTRV